MDFKNEFEKRRDVFLKDLQGLIEIPSVEGEPEGEYPFGKEVHRALEYMLELGESLGFEVKNVDNYGGHIDFPGTEEGTMGIVGHIDVVPAGDGWTCEPFTCTLKDDLLYGRGVQDDKGPTMLGLYAMKILKEMGIKPKKTIRLILGLDEETNWNGMRYYLSHEQPPDFGIVPDAEFPLIQCEKGLLQLDIVRKHAALQTSNAFSDSCFLQNIQGGTAPNVVAGKSEFTLLGSKKSLEKAKTIIDKKANEKGYSKNLCIKELSGIENAELIVNVEGQPAHAAHPERGHNAISIAMDLLQGLPGLDSAGTSLVQFYNEKIAFVTDGSMIGCGLSDDLSGKLTFNVGKISYTPTETIITVDIRYPVTLTKETVLEAITASVTYDKFQITELDFIKPIYQKSDDPIVVTLLDTYRKVSGDFESQPAVIGGATFARAIPNCMTFGPLFPGDPELEHQKDEAISVNQLFKAGVIYLECIYKLCCI